MAATAPTSGLSAATGNVAGAHADAQHGKAVRIDVIAAGEVIQRGAEVLRLGRRFS
jgi:hypothetical protein